MSILFKTFIFSAIAFIAVYLLRGVGWLSFVPGGIILLLLAISLGSGVIWGIVKTRRY